MQAARHASPPTFAARPTDRDDVVGALREVITELVERVELLEIRARVAECGFALREAGTVRVFE